MKNITKLKRTMTVFSVFLGLIFSGCNNNPETGTDTSGIKVLSEGQEITVNVGETITVKAEGKKAVEFSQEGLTISHTENGFFEITADSSMTDATVPVNFNDGSDEDEGIKETNYKTINR